MALPTTVRDDALASSTDLAQAGAVFNDATRLLDGGLWSSPADSNNQPAYLGMYTTDLHAVSSDIAAMLADPAAMTIGGTAYAPSTTDTAVMTEIESQLQTLLSTAPTAIGNSHAEVQAQQTVHSLQTEILNEVSGDPALAVALNNVQYATGTGANNVGFESLPAGADDPASLAAAKAPDASLAAIGQVFNAANNLAVGGLNHSNLAEFGHDMAAISQGLTNILNNPTELAQIEAGEQGADAALTTLHLQTVLNQINLQTSKFDGQYATDPNDAARSTNDNLLDIIDIVQNDGNLNTAAGGNGNAGTAGGFSEMPAYLNGPDGVDAHGGTITQFQDNQAQTNFWSAFLSEANVINTQLQAVAGGQDTPTEVQQLISQIQAYQKFGANFDQAQGGIFGARFDNELLGGTLAADTQAAVHGLTGIAHGDTGAALAADQAQILAAGTGFAADAGDVSGNNIPVGGGSYVGDATTVATATSPNGVASGTIPVTSNPDLANGTGAAAPTGTGATASNGTGTGHGAGGATASNGTGSGNGNSAAPTSGAGSADPTHIAHAEHIEQHFQQHFEHMWHL